VVSEIVEVEENVKKVSCNGGKTFGHPRVYITLNNDGVAECYYCGRRFERRQAAATAARTDAA